jgi:hypothetical protein
VQELLAIMARLANICPAGWARDSWDDSIVPIMTATGKLQPPPFLVQVHGAHVRDRHHFQVGAEVVCQLPVAIECLGAHGLAPVREKLLDRGTQRAGVLGCLSPLYFQPLGGLGVDGLAARGKTALLVTLPIAA